MWGKNKEFYRAGYLTEEPNLYRRTKAQHEGKKFQDYKQGWITTNEIGLTTREGYPAPRREKDGRRRCKMGSRDRGGNGKWRGKGKREKDEGRRKKGRKEGKPRPRGGKEEEGGEEERGKGRGKEADIVGQEEVERQGDR